MSIFNNIKKSLGFSVSEETVSYSVENEYISNSKESKLKKEIPINIEADSNVDKLAKDEQLKRMQLAIFDGVVAIFNNSLPDFIKNSIDEDAQKEYIFNSLEESIRKYIENVGEESRRNSELLWSKEKLLFLNEIKEVKSKCGELENAKEDLKKQLLSAERQKRALSTRLHDLEVQVTSFEAEKEQYELENRSLVNKLKASNVIDADIEALRNDNIRLQRELSDIKIRSQQSDNGQVNDLVSQISKLTEENNSLKQSIEQLKVKEELSDAMINELNEKASNALRQLQNNDREVKEIDDLSCKVNSLEKQLECVNDELKSKIKELNDAHKELEIIEEIQSEMAKFEAIKVKNAEEIANLKQEVIFHKARVKELEEDTESLKSTIENNLYNQAISEDLLKNEIKQLKELQKSQSNRKSRKKQDVSPVKISAIDESIVDADWLISIPPEGTVTRPASSTNPEDFGYQAPPKKNTPENEAQMSLW